MKRTRRSLANEEEGGGSGEVEAESENKNKTETRETRKSKETSGGHKYKQGEHVLAKWVDGIFYPATVHSVVQENVYEISYEDGQIEQVKVEDLMPDEARGDDLFMVDTLSEVMSKILDTVINYTDPL